MDRPKRWEHPSAGPLRFVLASAGAAPWVLPLARAALPLGRLGSLLVRSFVLLCHRIPERTLLLAGVPMPLRLLSPYDGFPEEVFNECRRILEEKYAHWLA